MVIQLLLALLAALVGMVIVLFLANQVQNRRAARRLCLGTELEVTLRAWSRRGADPEEVERVRSLASSDRTTLLHTCVRLMPRLDAAGAVRTRDALRHAGLFDRLIADLSHRSADRRSDACRLLGRLGCGEAIPAVLQRLEDRVPAVRRQAILALCDLRAIEALDRIVAVMDATGSWSDLLAVMAISRMGPAAAPRVGALLAAAESPALLKGLLQVTGQLGHAADPELVRRLAAHPDPEVRVEAMRTLGHIPPQTESVDVCLAAMDDAAWPTRALAARSLGRLGDPRAITRLERAMGDTAYWVRHHAGQALAGLGDPGQQALRRRLTDANPFVRDMATEMLFTGGPSWQAAP